MRRAALLFAVTLALLASGGATSPAGPPAVGSRGGPGEIGDLPLPAARELFLGTHYENPDPTGRAGAGSEAVAHRIGQIPADATGPLPSPRIFTTGGTPLEPSLAIRSDGTLVTVMQALRQHDALGVRTVATGVGPAVLVSRDGGVSWDAVHQLHPTTQDPMVHVDPATDRIFTVDYVGCQLIGVSDDAATWIESTTCGWNLDHQSLASGPPRTSTLVAYPSVTYLCSIGGGRASGGGSLITCSKSLDGGLAWAPTGEPAFQHVPASGAALPGAFCYAGGGHIAVAHDGRLLVPRGHCGQPWLAISDDEGTTWRRVQIATTGIESTSQEGGHDVAVAADAEGTLYAAWMAADWMPYYAFSRDGGETWSAPRGIAPPGIRAAALPTMAVGDAGSLAFVYMATDDARGPEAWWHAVMTITTEALADDPLLYSATLNDPADPLVRGECGPIRCQGVYDFLDLEVAPDGRPWAVFTDPCDLTSQYVCDQPVWRGRVATLEGAPSLRT